MDQPNKRTKHSVAAEMAATTVDSLQAIFDDPAYDTPRYRITRVIGSGTYGNVVSARLGNGPNLAVKIVTNKSPKTPGMPYDILRELCILLIMKRSEVHNVIQLHTWFSQGESRFFFLMEQGERSLRDVIQASIINNKFIAAPLEVTRNRTYDIANGLFALNCFGIFHRDVKPDNVIVFGAGPTEVLKITDFGISRTLLAKHTDMPMEKLGQVGVRMDAGDYMLDAENQVLTEHTGTVWYRAPELILGSLDYDTRVDMWALGAIIVELETGWPLCGCQREYEVWLRMTVALGTPTEESWPGVSKLPDYSSEFPKFRGKPIKDIFRRSDGQEQPDWFVEICAGMLSMDPSRRIVPNDALKTIYQHTM